MDRQYIRDHQIIERYLQGSLSPAEQEAFEEHYMSDPVILEELELTERLGQGMKDLHEAGQLREGVERRRPSWLWVLLASPQYAAAASVLLAASLLFSAVLYRDNVDLREARPLVGDSAVTRRVPVISVRGADVNVVPAPGEREWTVLLMEPGVEYDSYRATVIRHGETSSEAIWELSGLMPGYDERLDVGLPGDLLTPGDYEVRLAGRMSDWPAEREADESNRVVFRVTAGR